MKKQNKLFTIYKTMITEKTITEFLSGEYKEFAMYSIEGRAIPSVIDGFKPTQRKIIHGSSQIWKTGNEKTLKIFQLSGYIAANCFYHHGDASLSNAVINMAQRFKNNAPLLEEEGQFGSLRSPQAGAPRYIGTKLSDNFRLIYKDFDLLDYKEEEGESIEPKYFLPIVPAVLLNGSSGIAVGFASNVLNRDIKSIIDACVKVLSGKNPGEVKPSLNGFTGSFIQDVENNKRWLIRGKFERANTTTVKISELPPSMTYEKYEEILDKLVDDKIIVTYDDNCKDNIDYVIKFTRADLEKLDDEKLVKLLKLEESSTEIFSTLDEFGKLKIFENTSDIIKYFVDFRLSYYHKRKQFMLDKMNRDLKILGNRGRFIKAILDGKLKVNNVAKAQIIEGIEAMSLDKIDDSYDYLLRMPIYSLTKEMFDKLKEDFSTKKEEIKSLEATDPKDMYVQDLTELKKRFK
jgi:DNA gyrase/topoisomerase IV subunit A